MNEFWIEELEPGYYDLKFSKGLKSKEAFNLFGIWEHLKKWQNT